MIIGNNGDKSHEPPEKWDVVTRKPGDVGLAALVRLLIIDEVNSKNCTEY